MKTISKRNLMNFENLMYLIYHIEKFLLPYDEILFKKHKLHFYINYDISTLNGFEFVIYITMFESETTSGVKIHYNSKKIKENINIFYTSENEFNSTYIESNRNKLESDLYSALRSYLHFHEIHDGYSKEIIQ